MFFPHFGKNGNCHHFFVWPSAWVKLSWVVALYKLPKKVTTRNFRFDRLEKLIISSMKKMGRSKKSKKKAGVGRAIFSFIRWAPTDPVWKNWSCNVVAACINSLVNCLTGVSYNPTFLELVTPRITGRGPMFFIFLPNAETGPKCLFSGIFATQEGGSSTILSTLGGDSDGSGSGGSE